MYQIPTVEAAVTAYSLMQEDCAFGAVIGASVNIPFPEKLAISPYILPSTQGRLQAHYPRLLQRWNDVRMQRRQSYFTVLTGLDGFAWVVWWVVPVTRDDDPGLRVVDATAHYLQDPKLIYDKLPPLNRRQAEADFDVTAESLRPLFARAKKQLEEVRPVAVSAGERLGFLQARNLAAPIRNMPLCEVPAELWQPDSVGKCAVCSARIRTPFSRHHCRACGSLVCGSCSKSKMVLYGRTKGTQRVCDKCVASAQLTPPG